MERLGPFVPESVFERGVDRAVGEFPRVVMGTQHVVPKLGVGIKIDLGKFVGPFGVGLAQQRLQFRAGDPQPRAGFGLVFGVKTGLLERLFDEQLSDRLTAGTPH